MNGIHLSSRIKIIAAGAVMGLGVLLAGAQPAEAAPRRVRRSVVRTIPIPVDRLSYIGRDRWDDRGWYSGGWGYRPGWGYDRYDRGWSYGRGRWDLDRDGFPNWRDRDRDGDGIRNRRDRYPYNPLRRRSWDIDRDGIRNRRDRDRDGDGRRNGRDRRPRNPLRR